MIKKDMNINWIYSCFWPNNTYKNVLSTIQEKFLFWPSRSTNSAIRRYIKTLIHAMWRKEKRKARKRMLLFLLLCVHLLIFLPLLTHSVLFPSLSVSLPPTALLPSTDIVMLLHTTLSRLKRWSHEWSLQFKSTQPSRRLKWIFCIYSCNNDSIWGYYLQTVAEFSAALIMEQEGR